VNNTDNSTGHLPFSSPIVKRSDGGAPDPLTGAGQGRWVRGRGRGLRIALLYNLAKNAPRADDAPPDALDELDNERNVAAYTAALRAAGHTVFPMEGDASLPARLKRLRVDLCFNTCEGYRGDSREAQVPALLEMLGIPYTAARVLGLALTLDKAMTKRVLAYHGLPTPRFQEFVTPDDPLDPTLRFPLFAKPNREGTGKGITDRSILNDEKELRAYVPHLIQTYRQTVLVEEYVDGRDLTCGLVGNLDAPALAAPIPIEALSPAEGRTGVEYAGVHLFPISEVDYTVYAPGTEPVYSNRLKVTLADQYRNLCPAPIPVATAAGLRRLTLEVFRLTKSMDMARVDFRLDRRTGLPQILEINALPGITPISDLTLCAEAEGWTHADLVVAVLNAAIRRHGLQPGSAARAVGRGSPAARRRAHVPNLQPAPGLKAAPSAGV
jgi:D-alanine-D-alanine ligase